MSLIDNEGRPGALSKFFSGLAGLFGKEDPGAGDVHVDVPLGNDGRPRKKPKADVEKVDAPRMLKPMEDGMAHSPFPYDAGALANMRSDQKPRFFGAMTDQDGLDTKTMPLSSMTAMQNRVDPGKVEAMRGGKTDGKPPLVVRMNGRNYLADGHHRASAAYMDGKASMPVKFKDLSDVDNAVKRHIADDGEIVAKVCKVDDSLGLVFGWAIVCKINGQDYYDLNIDEDGTQVPEHIPEDAMTKAALGLMEGGAPGNEMHAGPDVGSYPFVFPMTTDVAKSMGIQTTQTGLMVAFKPTADIYAKFRDGTYKGFSIEGRRIKSEMVG